MAKVTQASIQNITVELGGQDVPLDIQVNKRARNISVRVDERTGGVGLVLPRFVSRAEGLAFVREKTHWILRQLRDLPPRVPFEDGAVIPILGENYVIIHRPRERGTVWVEAAQRTINVTGEAPHVQRRVTDWLKKEARKEISARADAAAATLGKRILKIQIRDTRSRWGSCSEEARLSFSWRLMMAPENVLAYVVAHEVAHLVELNHSNQFWRLVDRLCPGNEPAKYWLKRYGAALHRFG